MISSLTVVMPVYNEAKNIETAIKQTTATLDAYQLPYEVVIVNDGSVDETAAIASRLAGSLPNIQYIDHGCNQGIGAAFRSGVGAARMNYIILVPADNPLLAQDMDAFFPFMGKADIIAGCREERIGYPASLKFLSYMYNRVFVPVLFRIPLKDVNWIQMYRRSLFREWGITIESNGIFFFVEVLAKAHRKGAQMVEVPVVMRKRIHGKPTISRLPVILKTFRDMMIFFIKGLSS